MDVKKLAVAYATFVGFMVLTNLVVRPMLKKTQVPLLSESL